VWDQKQRGDGNAADGPTLSFFRSVLSKRPAYMMARGRKQYEAWERATDEWRAAYQERARDPKRYEIASRSLDAAVKAWLTEKVMLLDRVRVTQRRMSSITSSAASLAASFVS
jgi:hypothetical protein